MSDSGNEEIKVDGKAVERLKRSIIIKENMNLKTKRDIASWSLLAVFLSMLLLSSFHIHEINENYVHSECAHHHCSGHLTQPTAQIHQCLLCQFLTLSMLVGTLLVIIPFRLVFTNSQQFFFSLSINAVGEKSTRAPPFYY